MNDRIEAMIKSTVTWLPQRAIVIGLDPRRHVLPFDHGDPVWVVLLRRP
jgi:hypothetical protein